MESVRENQHIDPMSGEYVLDGVDLDGNTIAKDDESARLVAEEYLETPEGQAFRKSGLMTQENLGFIVERVERLFPAGYTQVQLGQVVAAAIACGDIDKPKPIAARPAEPGPEAEFEAFTRTATVQQRQERRDRDSAYRLWFATVAREQRSGSTLTADDIKPIQDKSLVEFVDAFKRATRDSLRPRNGWISVAGFQNGAKMDEATFEKWIDAATKARLL